MLNKKNAIEILESTVKGRYNVSQSIKAFADNWMSRKERAIRVTKILEKFIPECNSKNLKFFKFLRHSFDQIKSINVTVIKRYQIFLQRILPTVENIHEKIGIR